MYTFIYVYTCTPFPPPPHPPHPHTLLPTPSHPHLHILTPSSPPPHTLLPTSSHTPSHPLTPSHHLSMLQDTDEEEDVPGQGHPGEAGLSHTASQQPLTQRRAEQLRQHQLKLCVGHICKNKMSYNTSIFQQSLYFSVVMSTNVHEAPPPPRGAGGRAPPEFNIIEDGIYILVQNPQRKCSAAVETNCVVAEYRIPYRIGPRTIITHALRAPLIDNKKYALH